jgi:hypothetical protein
MSQTADAEPVAPTDSAEERIVAARLAAVLARWGERLDDAGRQAVEDRIRHHLKHARELQTVPLANGDEPEIVFVPFRAREEPAQ